jgi:predicted ATPase
MSKIEIFETNIFLAEIVPCAISISWELDPSINVLSGSNGSGKTVLLGEIARQCRKSNFYYVYITNYTQSKYDDLGEYLEELVSRENFWWKTKEEQEAFREILSTVFPNKNLIFGNTDEYAFFNLSHGQQRMLMFLMETYYHQEAIFIIDDIETHLDAESQKNILIYMKALSPNSQFIVSTHSPFIIMKGFIGNVTNISDLKNKK